MKRQTYQNGCVYQDTRRGLWYFRWRDADGTQRSKPLGKCPSRAAAKKRAAEELSTINADREPATGQVTVNELVTRYIAEKLPARFSTRRGYVSYLHTHILPKWGNLRLTAVKPYEVDEWLGSLALSQKSKSHVKGLMHLLFEFAMFWEYIPNQENPMRLVTVPGQTKRTRQPVNLSPAQFHALLSNITTEPFRTMTLTALCLGLRFSELTGLKWGDVDWMQSTVHIQRGVVRGIVDETKTASSHVELPVAKELLAAWKAWRVQTAWKADCDWMFASPYHEGRTPYAYSHLLRSLKRAAAKADIARISWHSLRHSYRTWMGEVGLSTATQQKLMRHADYRTTMNTYGTVLDETLRSANRDVVRLAVRTSVPPNVPQKRLSR